MKLKVQKKPQLVQACLTMTKKNEQTEDLHEDLDDICEECKNESESVTQNFIIYGFKICNSCNISKKIFPI